MKYHNVLRAARILKWLTITHPYIHTGGTSEIIPIWISLANSHPRSLRDAPIVLVGNPNYAKVDPILEKDFYKFEYLAVMVAKSGLL